MTFSGVYTLNTLLLTQLMQSNVNLVQTACFVKNLPSKLLHMHIVINLFLFLFNDLERVLMKKVTKKP